MSGYDQGREVEYAVVHDLTDNGYTCTRAASSKGAADVIAVKEGEVLFVSVKRSAPPGPEERRRLVRVAWLLPEVGVPLVAIGRPQLTYRRLFGVGPKEWAPWTPDTLTEPTADREAGYQP